MGDIYHRPGKNQDEGAAIVTKLFSPPENPGPPVKIQAVSQPDSTPHHAQGYAWDPISCMWLPMQIDAATGRLLVDTEINVGEITIGAVDIKQPGTVIEEYNEVNAVASGSLTTVVTYTVPIAPLGQVFHMRHVSASGCNVSIYQLEINGSVVDKKRSYWGNFNVGFDFEFETGGSRQLSGGDVVRVRVEHNRTSVGQFNGTIYGRLTP